MLQRIERFIHRTPDNSLKDKALVDITESLEPDKSRDIRLVEQYVHRLDRKLRIVEESNIYRRETGGVAPLQVVVENPERIVATIRIVTNLRADGTPPTGALFPVTFEKVKQILELGWQQRRALDKKYHIDPI